MAFRDMEAALYLALTLPTQPHGFGTSTTITLGCPHARTTKVLRTRTISPKVKMEGERRRYSTS